jgi:chorismate mutase
MDDKTKAIVLMKYRPMIEDFRKAIIEERKRGLSEARIEMMLDYIETENAHNVDPETLELLMSELTAAAKATHEGSGTVQ